MFGSGIYFAESPEIAERKAWFGGSERAIIEAEVALGRCYQPKSEEKSLSSFNLLFKPADYGIVCGGRCVNLNNLIPNTMLLYPAYQVFFIPDNPPLAVVRLVERFDIEPFPDFSAK